MHKLRWVLLLALAACGLRAPQLSQSYRNTGAGIYSSAAFDPSKVSGDWHEVQGFFSPGHETCSTGLSHIADQPDGALRLTLRSCDRSGGPYSVTAQRTAPGRFRPDLSGPLGEPWWILWVDQDYQTMAIGTPSGKFGAIVARDGKVAADRIFAARQILDFNGYDVKHLVPTQQ